MQLSRLNESRRSIPIYSARNGRVKPTSGLLQSIYNYLLLLSRSRAFTDLQKVPRLRHSFGGVIIKSLVVIVDNLTSRRFAFS